MVQSDKIDFGKRILSLGEAPQGEGYVHNGVDKVTPIYFGRFDDYKPEYQEEYQEYLLTLLNFGAWWTTRPGAERDLRAVQTIAEVRRLADEFGRYILVNLHGIIHWVEEKHLFCGAEFAQFRFNNPETCIDQIGQDRLREVYEAGRSL